MNSLDLIEMMVVFEKNYPNASITEIVVLDKTEIWIHYNYSRRDEASVKYNANLHLFYN